MASSPPTAARAMPPVLAAASVPPVLRHLFELTGSFECLGQTIN